MIVNRQWDIIITLIFQANTFQSHMICCCQAELPFINLDVFTDVIFISYMIAIDSLEGVDFTGLNNHDYFLKEGSTLHGGSTPKRLNFHRPKLIMITIDSIEGVEFIGQNIMITFESNNCKKGNF